MAKAHEKRNLAEYERIFDINESLLGDLIDAFKAVLAALRAAEGEK